jgi:hypothetical protein
MPKRRRESDEEHAMRQPSTRWLKMKEEEPEKYAKQLFAVAQCQLRRTRSEEYEGQDVTHSALMVKVRGHLNPKNRPSRELPHMCYCRAQVIGKRVCDPTKLCCANILSEKRYKYLRSLPCAYCHRLFPRRLRGIDRKDPGITYLNPNSAPACEYCNQSKSSYTEREFVSQAFSGVAIKGVDGWYMPDPLDFDDAKTCKDCGVLHFGSNFYGSNKRCLDCDEVELHARKRGLSASPDTTTATSDDENNLSE